MPTRSSVVSRWNMSPAAASEIRNGWASAAVGDRVRVVEVVDVFLEPHAGGLREQAEVHVAPEDVVAGGVDVGGERRQGIVRGHDEGIGPHRDVLIAGVGRGRRRAADACRRSSGRAGHAATRACRTGASRDRGRTARPRGPGGAAPASSGARRAGLRVACAAEASAPTAHGERNQQSHCGYQIN